MVAAQAAGPHMIARGSGSILFTGGGFGLRPHPDFLSLSIGKAGIRALAQGIFEPFREKGVHVATVTVAGLVRNSKDANALAEQFWQLHSQPAEACDGKGRDVDAFFPERLKDALRRRANTCLTDTQRK